MHDLTAKRTLVKSPPELWSELSEVDRLARHLEAFGEIKITRLVPEQTVAWEGVGASGTVSIEPSGWGTKVTLRAQVEQGAVWEAPPEEAEDPPGGEATTGEPAAEAGPVRGPEAETEPEAEPEPEAWPEPPREPEAPGEPELARAPGLFARLFRRRTPPPAIVHEEPAAPVEVEPVADEPAAPVEHEPIADEPAPEPVADQNEGSGGTSPQSLQTVLDEVLDALGSAHHRPFSRG